jgi:glucan phosphoethanolaminetransferase (alkaline phosphatase superfamily)
MQKANYPAQVAAFLLAPILPAVLLALVFLRSAEAAVLLYAVVLAFALLIGLPIYLFLKARNRAGFFSSVTAGAVTAVLPWLLLTFPYHPSSRFTSTVNNVPHFVDGVPTFAGLLSYATSLLLFGFLGAIAGLIFWLTIVSAATASRGLAALAISFGLIGIVLAGPSLALDRSCHNIHRNNTSSLLRIVGFAKSNPVLAKASITVQSEASDLQQLKDTLEKYAKDSFSIRNLSRNQPDTFWGLSMSICNETRGVSLKVGELLSDARAKAPRAHYVSIFGLRDDADVKSVANDLSAHLEQALPGKISLQTR